MINQLSLNYFTNYWVHNKKKYANLIRDNHFCYDIEWPPYRDEFIMYSNIWPLLRRLLE